MTTSTLALAEFGRDKQGVAEFKTNPNLVKQTANRWMQLPIYWKIIKL